MSAKKSYTIQITNNINLGEPPYSVYCEKWDIGTDDYIVIDALSGLCEAIKIFEAESKT